MNNQHNLFTVKSARQELNILFCAFTIYNQHVDLGKLIEVMDLFIDELHLHGTKFQNMDYLMLKEATLEIRNSYHLLAKYKFFFSSECRIEFLALSKILEKYNTKNYKTAKSDLEKLLRSMKINYHDSTRQAPIILMGATEQIIKFIDDLNFIDLLG